MVGEPGRVVRTNDGHEVAIVAALWEASPVLRNSPKDDHQSFALNCTKETLDLLLSLHREKNLPLHYQRTYELLTLTMELQLKSFTRLCLKHLFRNPDYWRWHYPASLPDEVVLFCFNESLSVLFRRKPNYHHEVMEIMRLHRGDVLKALVLDAVREKIREFMELGLDPVLASFRMRSLPIFIINYRGRTETAIGSSEKFIPLELFGKHFDLSKVEIDAFYLKYASYVLFKSQRKVFWKDLRQPTEARQMKENCTFLISREDAVFIVTEEDSKNHIWKWMEDEDHGGSFALILRTPHKISSLDFDPSDLKRLLILKDNGCLSISKLEDHELVSTRGIGSGVRSAWFYGKHVLAFKTVSGKEGGIKMHHIRLNETAFDEKLAQINSHWFKEIVEQDGIFPMGQVLCRISPHLFELWDTSLDLPPIARLNSEHYLASSELFLHP